jgi:hypothetical protein
MTALAATLQAFFTERLARQKNASPQTCPPTATGNLDSIRVPDIEHRGIAPASGVGSP